MIIRKKIVTDENMQPVAVQIDYADWLEIARRLDLDPGAPTTEASSEEDFEVLLDRSRGIWEGDDGLDYQRRIRAEWTRPWDPEAQADDTEDA